MRSHLALTDMNVLCAGSVLLSLCNWEYGSMHAITCYSFL